MVAFDQIEPTHPVRNLVVKTNTSRLSRSKSAFDDLSRARLVAASPPEFSGSRHAIKQPRYIDAIDHNFDGSKVDEIFL